MYTLKRVLKIQNYHPKSDILPQMDTFNIFNTTKNIYKRY